METGVGSGRVTGLDFNDTLSITITGWKVWRVMVLTTLVTWSWKDEWVQLVISLRYKKHPPCYFSSVMEGNSTAWLSFQLYAESVYN